MSPFSQVYLLGILLTHTFVIMVKLSARCINLSVHSKALVNTSGDFFHSVSVFFFLGNILPRAVSTMNGNGLLSSSSLKFHTLEIYPKDLQRESQINRIRKMALALSTII